MHDRSTGSAKRLPLRLAPALAPLAALLAACATAGPAVAPPAWHKIDTDPGFAGWRREIQHMADEFGHGPVNHFCVVVRTQHIGGAPDRMALVYWAEERQIQGFGPVPKGNMLDDTSMAGADAIDLAKDVVASEAQIQGSTSRVTRAYVDDILGNCRRYGMRLTIIRKKGER